MRKRLNGSATVLIIKLRIGTLAAILRDVAEHHGFDRDELLTRLFYS
ncbi:MAG: hypothetical protein WD873_01905 [Candidatus Hydrogenedentales bacterium]